jgi:hypothetical protein
MHFQSTIKLVSLFIITSGILLISCSKDEPIGSKTFALKQEFSVYENSPIGQFVGIAHAYQGNSIDTLMYSITSGNENDAFSIDMFSGVITVNNPAVLDYEKHPKFALGISAFKLSNLLDYDTTVVYVDIKNAGIPANGLVSYFGFNNKLDDYITNKNGIGTNISYFYDRRGWYRSAIEFIGLKSYLILDSIFDFPSRTVCFWFKALNINQKPQTIYCSDNEFLVNGKTIFSVRKTDSLNYLLITCGDATDSTKIYEGNWYQAAVTINGGAASYYINGQQFGQQNITSFLHSNCSTSKATLGVDCSLTNSYYQGLVDELIIFNRALNSQEIRNCYIEDDIVY